MQKVIAEEEEKYKLMTTREDRIIVQEMIAVMTAEQNRKKIWRGREIKSDRLCKTSKLHIKN